MQDVVCEKRGKENKRCGTQGVRLSWVALLSAAFVSESPRMDSVVSSYGSVNLLLGFVLAVVSFLFL